EGWRQRHEAAHLVGLVVMDRQPVALVDLNTVYVPPRDDNSAFGWIIIAGDQLEERGLAGAVRSDHAHNARAGKFKIRREREGLAARHPAAAVYLSDLVDAKNGFDHLILLAIAA